VSVQVKQFGPFPTIEQTDLSSGEWYWKAADGANPKYLYYKKVLPFNGQEYFSSCLWVFFNLFFVNQTGTSFSFQIQSIGIDTFGLLNQYNTGMGWQNSTGFKMIPLSDGTNQTTRESLWLIYEPDGNYLNFAITTEDNYNQSKLSTFLSSSPYQFIMRALR